MQEKTLNKLSILHSIFCLKSLFIKIFSDFNKAPLRWRGFLFDEPTSICVELNSELGKESSYIKRISFRRISYS